MRKVVRYLTSFRLHMFYPMAIIMLLGALISGHTLDWKDCLVLMTVAFCCHLFGFSMNDLADYRFDLHNPKHLNRISLVSQGYSKGGYLAVMLLQPPIIFVLLYFNYPEGARLPWIIAAALIVIYNLLGKRSGRFILPIHLLMSVATVVLFIAAYTLFAPLSSASTAFLLYLPAAFIKFVLINSFFGSIYDLKADLEAGAGSVAAFMGCRVDGEKVIISRTVRYSIDALYLLCGALILVQAGFNRVPAYVYPACLAFLFYGWAHKTVYLRIDDAAGLHAFHPGPAVLYLFMANSLAWIQVIPVVWWIIVVLSLVRPWFEKRPGKFGLATLKAFAGRDGFPN